MSGIVTLRIDTATAPALSDTQVIPVLSGLPTLSGFNPSTGPAASLVTVADLAAYLGGGTASVASFPSATDGAGAEAGTIANAPTAGDPAFWLQVGVGGTTYFIPCWASP